MIDPLMQSRFQKIVDRVLESLGSRDRRFMQQMRSIVDTEWRERIVLPDSHRPVPNISELEELKSGPFRASFRELNRKVRFERQKTEAFTERFWMGVSGALQ